ncbi:MAG: hypothetical protein JNK73_04845 [Bacteroidia bacterium]|nr:hypothetical protein [Bacteroidia bacterium]
MLTFVAVKIHIRFLNCFAALVLVFSLFSCQKKETLQAEEPDPVDTTKPVLCPDCEFPDTVWKTSSGAKQFSVRLKFDSTQLRLNDLGQPSSPGAGAQSPVVKRMSIDYIELMPNANTGPGGGIVIYKANETSCGGAKAINFCKGYVLEENEVLVSVDLNTIPAGSYPWIRISIAYQELVVQAQSLSAGKTGATLAGFSGGLTYLSKTKIQNTVLTPTLGGTGNKNRGYWMFYQEVFNTAYRLEGQAPHTTVVNSNPQVVNTNTLSFVYGQFVNSNTMNTEALVIGSNETNNREIILSLSTNKSFEWTEITNDGLFQPEIGENILDFGCRGLLPLF